MIVFAKDMRKMTAFHRDVLGMTPGPSDYASEDWQPFETGGDCELALHRIPEPWREGMTLADPPEQRAREGRRSRAPEPCDGPVLRFDIVDPEGNIVQISQE